MRVLLGAGVCALAVAALAWPVAGAVVAGGTEAWLIEPFDESKVMVNRALEAPSRGDPAFERRVVEMYGIVHGDGPITVVFVPRERFVRPEEAPSATILPVQKGKGENPLQAMTVYFFAKWASLAAGLLGAGLLGIWGAVKARRRSDAQPA